VAPRVPAQTLPQDVVVGQARPDAGGQAQVGGVEVLEDLEGELGRHVTQVGEVEVRVAGVTVRVQGEVV